MTTTIIDQRSFALGGWYMQLIVIVSVFSLINIFGLMEVSDQHMEANGYKYENLEYEVEMERVGHPKSLLGAIQAEG